MHANHVSTTGRFIDIFPHLCWLLAGGMLTSIIVSGFLGRVVLSTSLQVDPDTPTELKTIELKKEPIGALRIDVRANVPYNQWVTYEIQVKDAQGKVLASGIKQAWAESGTWAEDGESGSWAEEDLLGGLDVRPAKAEPVTIALDVLEYSDTTGKELDQPVSFIVTIENGVVDDRYLWTGFFGTSLLALMALFAVPGSGKAVVDKSIQDSDIAARNIMGGRDRLLRVLVYINADETAPNSLSARLVIKDSNGDQLYSHIHTVTMKRSKNDKGRVTSAKGQLCTFFVLEPRGSYGFYVEVTPDRSVDRTKLVVREGSRTLFPVQVTELKAQSC